MNREYSKAKAIVSIACAGALVAAAIFILKPTLNSLFSSYANGTKLLIFLQLVCAPFNLLPFRDLHSYIPVQAILANAGLYGVTAAMFFLGAGLGNWFRFGVPAILLSFWVFCFYSTFIG